MSDTFSHYRPELHTEDENRERGWNMIETQSPETYIQHPQKTGKVSDIRKMRDELKEWAKVLVEDEVRKFDEKSTAKLGRLIIDYDHGTTRVTVQVDWDA